MPNAGRGNVRLSLLDGREGHTLFPGTHALEFPDKAAHIMAGTGEVVTYRELNDRSNQLAQLLWDRGLRPSDHFAIFMENNARYL